jgi:UDP-N-acetylmuramoyl-tripeptide--D-alanyl-D-alanine ligase
VLASHPSPRLLVLGDMGEVGEQGPAFHAEVGGYAKARGIERLIAFGAASAATADAFGDGAEHVPTIEDACWRATKLASPQSTVLVKGSRSMRMERVVRALAGEAAGDGGHH